MNHKHSRYIEPNSSDPNKLRYQTESLLTYANTRYEIPTQKSFLNYCSQICDTMTHKLIVLYYSKDKYINTPVSI